MRKHWLDNLRWVTVLLAVHALDKNDKFWNWCGKLNIVWTILLGVLFWASAQTLINNPRPESADGLFNLYKPIFYLVSFLLGYFVFSHEEVQQKVKQVWIPLQYEVLNRIPVIRWCVFGTKKR